MSEKQKIKFLLLTAAGEDFEGDCVVSGWCPTQKGIEPAGLNFEEKYIRSQQREEEVEVESGKGKKKKKKDVKSTEDNVGRGGIHSDKKKATVEDVTTLLDEHPEHPDHYQVLGLAHLRRDATDTEIRNAFRRLSLTFHPDKANQEVHRKIEEEQKVTQMTEEQIKEKTEKFLKIAENKFKRIQEAFEVLTDPRKRQAFDSEEELLNITIPSKKEMDSSEFFGTFRPIFTRFSYFSDRKPVPDLGDEATSYDEVDKFYNFWWRFQSWRDFSHEDEHNLDEAESRDEKRWMERENEKVRKKKKAAEREKIRTLVESAYQRDPRLMKRREEEKQEKERIQMEKKKVEKEKRKLRDAERKQEDELRKQKEQEELQKIEEEKKQKEKLKKEKQVIRSSFRKNVGKLEGLDNDRGISLERILEHSNDEEIAALGKLIENALKDPSQVEIAFSKFRETANEISNKIATTFGQAPKPKITQVEIQKAVKEPEPEAVVSLWSDDEMARLTKAVTKYPIGTQNRWERISEYVETRTPDEVLKIVKLLKNSKHPVKEEVKQKYRAQQSENTNSTQDESESSTNNVSEPTPAPTTTTVATPKPTKNSSSTSTTATATPAATTNTNTNTTTATATPATSSTSVTSLESQGPPMEGWTKKQHQQMELAMKKYKQQSADRWDLITAEVEGKTKPEVMDHYKKLVIYYKQLKDQEK